MNEMKLALQKFGTLLVDRRAQVTAAVVALLVFAPFLGFTEDQVELIQSTFTGTYALLILAIPALVKILVVAQLVTEVVKSWTVRPPSGLNYKKISGPQG